jgi:hypothetical protein
MLGEITERHFDVTFDFESRAACLRYRDDLLDGRVEPTPPAGAISPTIPRSWHPGDRERLGHTSPPLGLVT